MVPVLVASPGWRAVNPPSRSLPEPYTETPCFHAQQPGQLPGRTAGQQLRHPGGAQVADELTERRGERGEWQAVGAKLQAATHQRPNARAT